MVFSKPLVNALSFYFGHLYEHPIRTKAITCCALATAGNYASQRLAGAKILNFESLIAYGIYGLFLGGTIPHYFYSFLEYAVPEDAAFALVKKLFLERLLYSPLYQAFTLYVLARLEGKEHKTAIKQLQDLYWVILSSSWKYLTIIHLLNLSVVPPMIMPGSILKSQTQQFVLNLCEYFERERAHGGPLLPFSSVQELRVLTTNIMGFFWTIYIANQRRQQQASSKSK